MLKNIAMIFGIVMVVIGVLGFTEMATPNGRLFGIFHVNAEHNYVHILTGVFSIICGFISWDASRVFFKFFGVLYCLVALLGIYYGDQPILGMISNNTADVVLHFVISIFALGVGFAPMQRDRE